MWMWMPICVPAPEREREMFSHPEYQRWLPAKQIVWGADAGGYMFDQRLIGKVLQDLGALPPLKQREPFENALMHQMIRLDGRKMSKHLGNVVDPNALVATVGADAVRLAVLSAASPGRIFNWNEQPVRAAQAFLGKLWDYAEPRLREWGQGGVPATGGAGADAAAESPAHTVTSGRSGTPRIDVSDKLRRRLANWCTVAREKVTTDFERLELQRAANNTMLLLQRIQDFERRARERRGELDEPDREALLAALLQLVQMLAPLTPHIAEELWALGGNDTLLASAPWPERGEREQGMAVGPAAREKGPGGGTAAQSGIAARKSGRTQGTREGSPM
jgi:leucyl-tRNA synthetase